MNRVKITAVRKTEYPDLMAKYENPILHTCDVLLGQSWISEDGKRPTGMCESAWGSMREFVEALARGEGNFFDGWMKNPMSAMISCNDGFRPVSFYLEVLEDYPPLNKTNFMSKYDALWKHIAAQDEDVLKLSFSQIGEIAGIPLDHSFLRFKKELLAYGYEVGKISLKEETVIFKKKV